MFRSNMTWVENTRSILSTEFDLWADGRSNYEWIIFVHERLLKRRTWKDHVSHRFRHFWGVLNNRVKQGVIYLKTGSHLGFEHIFYIQ